MDKKWYVVNCHSGYEEKAKNALIDQWQRSKSKESDRKTTMRLAIIIALLVGFFSWLFELHTLL